jgi:DNA topoisomerase-1
MACQMKPAESDRTTVDVEGADPQRAPRTPATLLRATSALLVFAGFLAVYGATPDDAESESEKDRDRARAEREEREGAGAENKRLPPLEKGEALALRGVKPEQHFTEPPPRYNEGSLIKFLEAEGIGRPSTYATIISTIQERGYVEKEGKVFRPTPIGHTVNDLLTAHFASIVDTRFTAGLEEQLDEIAEGKVEWHAMLAGFANPFLAHLAEKMATLERVSVATGEVCPQCGKDLVERTNRYGKYVACSGYPECDYIKREPRAEPRQTGETCPNCGKPLVERAGRYGPFLSCSGYPDCKYIKREPRAAPRQTDQTCPDCGKPLVERAGRFGPFLSCSGYPTCKYIKREKGAKENGQRPARAAARMTDVACPTCGSPMVERTAAKGRNAGKPFLGCSTYPKCKATLELGDVPPAVPATAT